MFTPAVLNRSATFASAPGSSGKPEDQRVVGDRLVAGVHQDSQGVVVGVWLVSVMTPLLPRDASALIVSMLIPFVGQRPG